MRATALVWLATTAMALPACAQTAQAQRPAAQQAPAQQPAAQQGAFALEPLPYEANALEPVIGRETMELHHGAHHRAYVDALNNAVRDNAQLRGLTLEQLMARMSTLPKAVRDNGGGHWNHRFFWQSMAPPGRGGQPSPQLQAAIQQSFGSTDAMRERFEAAGRGQFGSGWAWLIVGQDGRLAITSTPNQDNPLMDLAETRGAPILGNDVWEHAYYLNYRNRRGEYLSRWWEVVNWNEVSRRFAEARGGQR